MQSKPTSAVIKGIMISLLLIIFSIITFYTGLKDANWVQWVGYGIFLIGIVWSIAGYAKQINYNSTFGKYFLHGFSVSAIITCLMIIYTAVFVLVDPSMKEQALEKAAEEMSKNPVISQDQIDQALDITKKFFLPMVLGTILLGYIFFGTLFSLITAAIIKKEPKPDFEQEDFGTTKPIE